MIKILLSVFLLSTFTVTASAEPLTKEMLEKVFTSYGYLIRAQQICSAPILASLF